MQPNAAGAVRFCIATFALLVAVHTAAADGWRAGTARTKITPERSMWMSGYGARDRPAEGTSLDLWAKVLVLEDARGKRVVLVTLDLVGIARDSSVRICGALREKYGLDRAQVMLAVSHTHCGPVVGRNLSAMYFLDQQQLQWVDEYAEQLEQTVVKLVGEAIDHLAPCALAWGSGQATFAVNRRNNKEADVPQRRQAGGLVGPVDYDVPVLAVRDAKRELVAVAFGYACHATVLDFYQWSGDYPGYAQRALEESHPGMTALFWAGCGADQNPVPRRRVELAEQYGNHLAQSVDRVLAGVTAPVEGNLAATYREIELPFGPLPTRESLLQQSESTNKYEAQRGRLLLARVDAGQPLSPTYPYPIQCWWLGRDVRWLALGGEVVVDYALRLKAELAGKRTWVAGYANDVMAYIPSRRVLAEGGYEGGGAMVYYGLPTVWAPEVEGLIVREARAQAGAE
ncbi:MAG TPA: neutral/alkaline non-lysosomal ceramidase N-terminal domain-containing protein [Pirellulales bacterium]|nr:neutral/alkaline non-lysosomal ceramidase N-terminal domain-containing protein [Pirellulales bacterium]